ncbi:endomembrane protein [Plasmodium ovale wallikeri]|uniref:Transmembrane 9 superfamily member n=1 Tax=Plasmodium ovale wallikeri TaxID=864142 RepID=A0A1A8YMK1_PLAOA|nr:endomembrane protein [Plasmodium ovale wallikeri]SBT33233.1 endomembrane protein [Plasmodium ovale wallikeri]
MMHKLVLITLFFILLCFVNDVGAYLPGMNPTTYRKGDKVVINIKNLSSRRAVTSLNYFSFPLCSSDNANIKREKSPNIFKIISGDNIHNTTIETSFLNDKTCTFYCNVFIDEEVYNKYKHLILFNYNMVYSVDNLEIFREDPRRKGFYYTGIPIGYIQDRSYHLYTYYKITILYNNSGGDPNKNHIVGFEVEPKSVDFSTSEECEGNETKQSMEKNKYVTFKYDVKYVKSDKPPQHRSEHYYQLFFLFTSLWKSNVYYLFGFLFLVIFLLGLLSAQLSISLTYYTLSCEDYNWWWKSFIAPGSSGIFLFLYSVYYYFLKLSISSFAETFIYFAYSFVMSYTCFIYTGTAGFLASFVFLRKIYSSIKVD